MSRVAITVEQFWHKVPGGTARATSHTLRALQRQGLHDLVGVAARHGSQDPQILAVPVPVAHARWPRPLLYEAWHRLGYPSARSIVGDVDLIWASAMVVPPVSAPIVVTVHDLDFLDHPEWLSRRGKRFFPRAWQVTKKRAGIVVCPSETVASACERHGLDIARLRVVPWGVESTPVDPAAAELVRTGFGLPERFALWVGTLEPRKNLERVVRAVESIDGLALAVVGPTGWNHDDEAVLKPLEGRVFRLGDVADQDLHCLYAAASVFVFPSLAEGFGLPVLEAMAQGTPVITSSGTATQDAAKGAALLVDPLSTDQIASAIRTVLTDRDCAARLSSAGREVAAASSWDSTALGYSQAFAEVIR